MAKINSLNQDQDLRLRLKMTKERGSNGCHALRISEIDPREEIKDDQRSVIPRLQ